MQPPLMMRNLQFEFELGPLSIRIYNVQIKFPGTKWTRREPLTISF